MTEEKEKSTQNKGRTRNWTFILYPESAPTDWREQLASMGVAYAISPLHDKDINPTGEPKKPHHHIIIVFDSVKSYKQAEEISKSLNASVPQACKSLKGSLRYFTHKDNPEKYQYSDADTVAVRIDYNGLVKELTASDRHTILKEMIDFIKNNNITEFIDFADYCCNERFDDWFCVLADTNTLLIKEIIKSNHFKYYRDLKNGEI